METTNKLPEDFKAKWVAALRSGEYEQAKSELSTKHHAFCCLGVACLIAGHDVAELIGKGFITDVNPEDNGIAWLISDKVPSVIHGCSGHAYRLQQMNDVANYSFSEIADYIEANL